MMRAHTESTRRALTLLLALSFAGCSGPQGRPPAPLAPVAPLTVVGTSPVVAPDGTASCGTLPLLGTSATLTGSPRPDIDAERLALRAQRDAEVVVASEAIYQRIARDLASLRAAAPDIPPAFHHFGARRVMLHVTPAVIAAQEAGTYQGLDCLNAWTGAQITRVMSMIEVMTVRFDALVHPGTIARLYRAHPDVLGVEADRMFGGGDDITLCNEAIGGTHRYMIHTGWGDCPAGCIHWSFRGYEVSEEGVVTPLGDWGDGEAPAWVTPSCFWRP